MAKVTGSVKAESSNFNIQAYKDQSPKCDACQKTGRILAEGPYKNVYAFRCMCRVGDLYDTHKPWAYADKSVYKLLNYN